jgi:cell division protein FtsB
MMDRLEYGQKCIHLKEEIKYYKNEIKQSQRKMNELESNKDGLERFAREQYLMKKEEEDIFIFEEK